MSRTESILLGSGDIYVKLYDGSTLPEIADIKKDENKLGEVSGGATLEYKPSFYMAKSDSGRAAKQIITDEEATLKTGLMTFSGNSLAKLSDTARVTEDSAAGTRTLKVGGIGNMKRAKYVILFHHADADAGDIDILIVGQNQSGFSLSFAKDKETVIDAEFKCLPQDTEGTLIQYIEYAPKSA